MKNFGRSLFTAIAVALLTACGGGGGSDNDESTDIVDEIIQEQLAFEGVYENEDGLVLELENGRAIIRALGNSELGLNDLMEIGEAFMTGMLESGPDRWSGTIATIRQFDANDPNSKIAFLEPGTATLTTGGTMTVVDGLGVSYNFTYVGPTWDGPVTTPGDDEPTTPDDPVDPVDPGAGTGEPDSAITGIEGDRKSSNVYTIDVPSGTSTLTVTLSEAEFGSQLADLFVRRDTEAEIVDEPQPYSWTADCASVLPNRETETCTINSPPAGRYYITVYGYHEYWGADLKVWID
jgi:hypothetical protein